MITSDGCSTHVLIVSPHIRRRESLRALVKAVADPRKIILRDQFTVDQLKDIPADAIHIFYDGSTLPEEKLREDLIAIQTMEPTATVILYLDQPKQINSELTRMAASTIHAGASIQALRNIFKKDTDTHENEHSQ